MSQRVAQRELMVFHAPFPLQPDRVAASMLRPLAMRQAFADLGYEVLEVTGYAAQRRRAMDKSDFLMYYFQ